MVYLCVMKNYFLKERFKQNYLYLFLFAKKIDFYVTHSNFSCSYLLVGLLFRIFHVKVIF